MAIDGGKKTDGALHPRTVILWAAPLAALFFVWIWQAFSSGGYLPGQWLPAALLVGLAGLVASLFVAYPRRPRQLSLAVLALFATYAIWVAFSMLWAASTNRAWLEADRTFFYLLFFALALVFLADRGARLVFRYLILAGSLLIVVLVLVRLGSTQDLTLLFQENRFVYPISYPNGAAALYLIPFWPLMWLAVDPREHPLLA